MDYFTEQITEKNFSSFLKVFKASFNLEISESYFRNKFNTGYTNCKVIGFIAFEKKNNSPVAFCGVFPTIVFIKGEEHIAAQCGDLGTLLNHRKKGLFKLLHDLTMEQCKKDGISFIFAFPYPNAPSYYGFKKFGWSDEVVVINILRINKIKFVSRLIRKLFPSLFLRLREIFIKNHTLGLNELKKIIKDESIFPNDQTKIIIPRTFEYLKYKLTLGSILLKLKNGTAWISIKDNKIEIGDLFGNDIYKIIEDLIFFSEMFGFNYLSIRTSNEELHDLLIGNYSFREDHHHHLVINCLNTSVSDKSINYTGGDLDFFGL